MSWDKTAVFYINLDRSPDRRKLLEVELKREGIEAERFSAIDGKKVSLKKIQEYKKHRWMVDQRWGKIPKTRHLGRLGIHLSHIHIIKRFQLNQDYQDKEYLLILEDDIQLARNFKTLFNEAVRLAPKDWEILFLSSAHAINGQKISNYYVKPYPGHRRFTNHGMFCYLVKRSAIPRLLRIVLPISYKLMHIDHVIREQYGSGIHAYYLTTKIAKHRDEMRSDRERVNKK